MGTAPPLHPYEAPNVDMRSPTPPPPERQQTISGETDHARAERYRRERDAQTQAITDLLQRVSVLEKRQDETDSDIGEPGDPTKQRPPTGLIGAFVRLEMSVDALTASIDADRKAREKEAADAADRAKADALADAKRREPMTWASRIALGAVIVGIIGAALASTLAMLGQHVTIH